MKREGKEETTSIHFGRSYCGSKSKPSTRPTSQPVTGSQFNHSPTATLYNPKFLDNVIRPSTTRSSKEGVFQQLAPRIICKQVSPVLASLQLCGILG